MIEKVLLVDDEPLILSFLKEIFRRRGIETVLATNGEEALLRLREMRFDLVVTDLKMPKRDGMQVLAEAKSISPHTIVIVATGFGTVETAVEAMKAGAFTFLLKPYSPEALEIHLQKVEEFLRAKFLAKEQLLSKCPELIAISPAMKKITADLEKIAIAQASVFITGESGTGKEVIAGAIHRLSKRRDQPFIKVNCAAIPETLVESEFFGHERGAFTGAMIRKTGRFELADQGTLLLDEVTEIPLALQAKLLRAIQEMEFERVGGTKSIKVNVRMVATSNRNMNEAIESKIFREDLYYRLNVIPIHLPPLRERPEDILPLAEAFLSKFCQENHKPRKNLTPSAEQKLLSYGWPGNVRELANVMERAVVLDFDPEIDGEHLFLAQAKTREWKATTLHAMEKQLILETLEAQGNNRTKTAAILDISVRTLRNKLHEYGAIGED